MKILLATNNVHKVEEIKGILGFHYTEIFSLQDVGFDRNIEETGKTYYDNSKIKAMAAYKEMKDYIIFGEDSGFEVDYLNGEPGVYSARFGREGLSQSEKNKKILKLLNGVEWEKRGARFICVIFCIIPGGESHFFNGVCNGRIIEYEKGERGFGYDPIFIPEGFEKTFAELSSDVKNTISHRAAAFKLAKEFLIYSNLIE